jgi:NADH-quinone oxidoreductase subunit I
MQQLTNRSIIVSNKKMTFLERIYLPGIISGMAITMKHFFGRKTTILYPEVNREFIVAGMF